LARSTNIKWIQAQGGWASAKGLLDTYGHYLPTETTGYADALSNDTGRHNTALDNAVPCRSTEQAP
jgi:hypothetical protein